MYKMLEDPINMYGLLEDEFIVFLRDISTSSSRAIYSSCDVIVIVAHCAILVGCFLQTTNK